MQSPPKLTALLFREVEEQFRLLPQAARCTTHIEIAGTIFRLEFANEHLIPLILPALAHRQVDAPAHAPHLTIRIWDTASTGVPMAQMPWQHSDFGARREIRGANGGGFAVAYDLYCGIFSIVSMEHGRAYWWVHSPAQIPDYERAAPLREIVQAWFDHTGGTFIHGAAVGDDGGCVVLVGRGGAGKSTTALASLSGGLRLLGEDYCLLTGVPSQPRIHSLYNSAKLDNASLQRLPHYASLTLNPQRTPDEKAILLLHPHFPLLPSAPVRAILLPRIADAPHTQVTVTSAAAALRALAPSTIMQLSGMGQTAFDRLKAFTQSVPVYLLHLGQDINQIPHILTALLGTAEKCASE